jgi:hypothetical protein
MSAVSSAMISRREKQAARSWREQLLQLLDPQNSPAHHHSPLASMATCRRSLRESTTSIIAAPTQIPTTAITLRIPRRYRDRQVRRHHQHRTASAAELQVRDHRAEVAAHALATGGNSSKYIAAS